MKRNKLIKIEQFFINLICNIMKTLKLVIPILIIALVFTYCKKDDDSDDPDN